METVITDSNLTGNSFIDIRKSLNHPQLNLNSVYKEPQGNTTKHFVSLPSLPIQYQCGIDFPRPFVRRPLQITDFSKLGVVTFSSTLAFKNIRFT